MAELKIYTNSTLPDAYAHQHQSFVRIHWFDIYTEYPDAPLTREGEPATQHFMFVQGDALVSSASVVRKEIECDDAPYICYGIAEVMTFPSFRKRG